MCMLKRAHGHCFKSMDNNMISTYQKNDPSKLLRLRDSIYASDLLICAVAHLDFFTCLKDTS